MTNPAISVGIPYTDQGHLLAEAITSVISQTFQDWELILYGDSPNDETLRVAESFADRRIRHVLKTKRSGLAAALNEIAHLAHADLLARMDGDDVMHPERLERQFSYLLDHPEVDVVGTRAFLIDENSNLIGSYNEPLLPSTAQDFLHSNSLTHPTVMGRREWFIANRYDESLLRAEDKELWLRTAPKSVFAKMEDILLYYRIPSKISWHRQARDSSYDRSIMRSYSDLAPRQELWSRILKSHLKQSLVFLLANAGMSRVIYRHKYTALSPKTHAAASMLLEGVLATLPQDRQRVLAVTVTYGQRTHLVEQTVSAALLAGATGALIIDNGMAASESQKLSSLYGNSDAVRIHRLEMNEGSAAGFHAGLKEALRSDYDYYWLLDDDNKVVQGSVDTLVSTLLRARQNSGAAVGVAAVRNLDEHHQKVLRGLSPKFVYPPLGAFMYFDVATFIAASIRTRMRSEPVKLLADIPTAPYGGLLVDRACVDSVGLPNQELGLYEDDTEWTSRIAQKGTLILYSAVLIEDLVGKHTHASEGSGPNRLLASKDQTRVFFAVRNRVYWEHGQATGRLPRARYCLNRIVYLGALTYISKRTAHSDALASIRKAICAGEAGDLSAKLGEMASPK